MSIFACIVGGCDTAVLSRGLCGKHYARWRNGRPIEPGQAFDVEHRRPGDITRAECVLAKVGRTTSDGNCWPWLGFVNDEGYGCVSREPGHAAEKAHRVVYQLLVGPIPAGLELDHKCHNVDPICAGGRSCAHRRCVNPNHLEPATHKVNGLRGKSFSAKNARKEECPRGHRYPMSSAERPGKNARYCTICLRERTRQRRDEERAGIRPVTRCPKCQDHMRAPGRPYCPPCHQEDSRQRRLRSIGKAVG